MLKKLVLLIVISALCISMVLTGCSSGDTEGELADEKTDGEVTESTDKSQESEKIFRTLSVMAASNANPHIASTSYDDEVSTLINAGLYRYLAGEDRNSSYLAPELADGDPKQMDELGRVWQIKINKDAKWSNGEPIDADTFMYSWRMALDPVLLNPPAISLAQGYIEIENAEKYYTQIADEIEVDWEDVGIKKIVS